MSSACATHTHTHSAAQEQSTPDADADSALASHTHAATQQQSIPDADADSALASPTEACRLTGFALCTDEGTRNGALTFPFTAAAALAEAAGGDTACLPTGLELINLVPPTVSKASRCSSSTARTSLAL